MAGDSADDAARDAAFAGLASTPFIDDAFVLATLARSRTRGIEAYVLPQRPDLPFGWTREDLLLWKRPA